MLRVRQQVLGQRGAGAQHGHQVARQLRGRDHPGRQVGVLLVEPAQPREGQVGVGAAHHQVEDRRLLGAPALQGGERGGRVQEAATGQGALGRLQPCHGLHGTDTALAHPSVEIAAVGSAAAALPGPRIQAAVPDA